MRLSTRVWNSVNSKSLFTAFVIGLGIIGFTMTGIGRIGGGSMDANTAARVGEQQITMRQLDESVQQMGRQSGEDAAKQRTRILNALDNLIRERILVEEANRIGWGANDLEVAYWIRSNPSFKDPQTKAFDAEAYRRFMKSGMQSELDFYRMGRDRIAQVKLFHLLSLPLTPPPALAAEQAKRDSTEFKLEYAEAKASESAVEAEAKAQAKAFAADAANAARLKTEFEASKQEYTRPAQVRARGLLIAFKEATRAQGEALNRSEAAAKALAENLHARLLKGEAMAKLARETNDDLQAKQKDGEMGWLDGTRLDPESVTALFALNAQEKLSPVVKTPFGFRIFEWEEARAAMDRSFDDVKEELALRLLKTDLAGKRRDALEGELRAALAAKDKAKLEERLKQEGITWKELKNPVNTASRFIDELGLSDPLLKHLFTLKAPGDTVPELLEIGGRRVVMRLLSRSEGKLPEEKQMADTRKSQGFRAAQAFIAASQKSLFERYTKDKEIQRNKSLLELGTGP